MKKTDNPFNQFDMRKIDYEVKLLVNLFLKENLSDIELSKRTGISSSTVGRRLTNRGAILACFPENGEEIYEEIRRRRQENLSNGKLIGSQKSKMTALTNGQDTKLRLDVFSKDPSKQMRLLLHIALTFRATIDTIYSLFQINIESIVQGNGYSDFTKALYYLNYVESPNQEAAKAKIILFYRSYLGALKAKDVNECNKLIRRVTDYEVNEVRKKHLDKNIPYAEEETIALLKYQLKYAIKTSDMEKIFGMDRTRYNTRIQKLLETPENLMLRKKYEHLSDYHRSVYFNEMNYARK